MSLSNLINPMAIFRRTNTPMSPDRSDRRRQIQEREADAYRILGEYQERASRAREAQGITRTRQLIDELSNMTFQDDSNAITRQQFNEMYELMTRSTSIRRTGRREGNQGGYDLVHKA